MQSKLGQTIFSMTIAQINQKFARIHKHAHMYIRTYI